MLLNNVYFKVLILNKFSFQYHLSHSPTKQTKWPLRPLKTRIKLGIRPVWWESSLSAWRNLDSLLTPFNLALSFLLTAGHDTDGCRENGI